jgi:ComF family protein
MLMNHWRKFIGAGFSFLFTSRCPLCQRFTAADFCLDCQRQVTSCRLPNPQVHWQGDLPVFSWGAYQGSLKRAIAALKYNNQPQIARPLGQGIGQAWLDSAQSLMDAKPHQLLVVPIPLHAARQQQRGYNQAELLAEHFSRWTGVPLQRQGLLRTKATDAQFALPAAQREQNLTNAFHLGIAFEKHLPKGAVLLFDDIYTTGTTARSAAKTLRQAGVNVVGIITVAQALLQ